MSNLFLGQIVMLGCTFPPRGTAFCDGQLIPIPQNTALFSLLGTFYGGNGTSNFALPNLQGCVPMHMGQGPGLTPRDIGETGGAQTVTLTALQIPAHTHVFNASTVSATGSSPSGLLPATPTAANASAYAVSQPSYPALAPQNMNSQSCGVSGGSQAHGNMMPTLFINFVITLQGVFPARN